MTTNEPRPQDATAATGPPGADDPTGPADAPGFPPTPDVPADPVPPETGPPSSAAPEPGSGAAGGEPEGPRIIRSDADAADGLTKCPRCGATEISLNVATGALRCAYCRHEWEGASADTLLEINEDIGALRGVVQGSGTSDIVASTQDVMTFKCSACGAEVVVDTASAPQARCHWCRNTLSVNQQVPNGAVPDMVLPFTVTKDQAVENIRAFVSRRMAFAHRGFRTEFTPENVMGVYLPYMVVDINAHVDLRGQGEHQTRSYTVKKGDKQERRYDADVHDVRREFDLHVSDLTVESSQERRDRSAWRDTNNIINSIMPFDVENSVRWDANYLAGFSSERRDSDISDLVPVATSQTDDIALHRANGTVAFYDRGVRWDDKRVELVGQRWMSAYLPVWLYSYRQEKRDGSGLLHYVAVNGRTGETMGSVPLDQKRLVSVSALVQVVGIALAAVLMAVGS